jgi:hypothetical protein
MARIVPRNGKRRPVGRPTHMTGKTEPPRNPILAQHRQSGNHADLRWVKQRLNIICASWADARGDLVLLAQEFSRQESPAGSLTRDLMRSLGRAGEEVHHLRCELAGEARA